jgi:hypothetical protein
MGFQDEEGSNGKLALLDVRASWFDYVATNLAVCNTRLGMFLPTVQCNHIDCHEIEHLSSFSDITTE